jgi:subtilisin family serine protease
LYMSSLKSSILQCLQKTENKLRGAPEIKIAVLDTGVDSKHPFIDEAITRSKRIVCLKSFVQEDPSTEDEFGHGTHITNILLKIAPKAQIYVAKVSKTGDIPLTHKIDEVRSTK